LNFNLKNIYLRKNTTTNYKYVSVCNDVIKYQKL